MKFSFLISFYLSAAIILIISLIGLPLKFKTFRFFVNIFTKNMVIILKIFQIKIEVVNSQLATKKAICMLVSINQCLKPSTITIYSIIQLIY